MQNLTDLQRSELVSKFVEIIVNGMDQKTLVQYVTDDLEHFYENKCDDNELKEFINEHSDDLFNQLLNNINNLKES